MLLENKNAVIYGAGGAVGGAVARAFAREGARLFLVGRRRAPVEAVAREIVSAGGFAEAADVDALDEVEVGSVFYCGLLELIQEGSRGGPIIPG